MGNKPQEQDLRKHFEAILGHGIEDAEANMITLSYRTGVWSKELDTGHATSQGISVNGDATKVCNYSRLLSIGGQTITSDNGKADFSLSEHHCENDIHLELPIILIATPQSERPVFVTTHTFGKFNGNIIADFRIQISTWEAGGAPAKGVTVNWFCQLPFVPRTFF